MPGEFIPWSNGCPAGYVPIDADAGQAGATPSMWLDGFGQAHAGQGPLAQDVTQYYLRCIRQDIFTNPELSTTEPVTPLELQQSASLGQQIQDALTAIGSGAASAGKWVVVGLIAIAALYVLPMLPKARR